MILESQNKSKIILLKLVFISGLIVLGTIAGKYIIQAISPPSWTDSTITVGETLIRKVHIDELRSEINANRADVGLTATTWTDPLITAGETLIRAVHFTEARDAIVGIFNKILETPPTWTDATLTPGETIIRKIHLDELRTEITNAYNLINAKKCCGSYGGSNTGSAGACPGTDDSACGTIDCSGWYVQTGTEGPTHTEYCYNKQDITTNRCEGIDDCKDPNTSDCNPQPNDALQYSCGTCKYIAASDCTGTTLGNCTNYPSGTTCGNCYDCDGNGNCVKLWGSYGSNLLTNPGFETGNTNGWSVSGNIQILSVLPNCDRGCSGSYCASDAKANPTELSQVVDVSSYATKIDMGCVMAKAGACRNKGTTEQVKLIVEYRNSANQVLQSYNTGWITTSYSNCKWFGDERVLPANTRNIRIRLIWGSYGGSTNDNSWDDAYVKIKETTT